MNITVRQQVRLAWNKALYSHSTYINKACYHVVTLTVSRDDVEAKTKRGTDGVSSWAAAAGLSVHYLTSFNPRDISGEVKGQTGHAPSTGGSPKQAGENGRRKTSCYFHTFTHKRRQRREKRPKRLTETPQSSREESTFHMKAPQGSPAQHRVWHVPQHTSAEQLPTHTASIKHQWSAGSPLVLQSKYAY